jgi:N-acetylmuramoyl-L-alanine amidase
MHPTPRRFAIAGWLALAVVVGRAAWAAPADETGQVTGFSWETPQGDRLVFTLTCDRAPSQLQVTDDGFRQQGFYIDLYGVTLPSEPAEWAVPSPLVYHVRRLVYPDRRVLRFVFYTRGPAVFVPTTREGGRQITLEVTPLRPLPGRKLVVIDPGHGGRRNDPGASWGADSPRIVGRVHYEKDIVLAIAQRLERLIARDPNLDGYLTRTSDRYLSLDDRIAIANRVEGDLFLSIHLNASDTRRKTARGFEVYYLDDSDRAVNRTLLALENDVGAGMDERVARERLGDLLRSLAGEQLGRRRAESRVLAEEIDDVFRRAGPFRDFDRGVKYAPFRVLMNYKMPAVLVECGFLDHPVEARALIDARVQDQIAGLLHESVQRYFTRVDPAFAAAGGSSHEP